MRTCKDFQFWEYHGMEELSIKKDLSQPYKCHTLLKMVWLLLEVAWMVSNRFDNHHISQVQTCSFCCKIEQVSHPSPINPMDIWTLTRWWLVLSAGILMVSKRFVNFYFLQIWQVRPKNSSRWWVIKWKNYGWFLIEFQILDFSPNFTGPDLQ